VYADEGDARKHLEPADLDVRYRVPFQAHAPMEPLNCTVHWRDGKMDIWLGNQSPTLVRWVAAEASQLPTAQITVHTPYLGGGFGRRTDVEVLRQAIGCAKVANGRPVKLTWSREEDIQHDGYRPAVACRMRAKFDAKGEVLAWHHQLAGMSVMYDFTRRIAKPLASEAMADFTNCEGALHLPYSLPHFRVTHSQIDENVPLGFWRSVGNSYTAFFVETFVDELAHARQDDPYLFRQKLMKRSPRFARVLNEAASKAGWAGALPVNGGRGIAIAESFKSIVAMVVDVRVKGKAIVVDRVVAAVDCGRALHPSNARAQIEGAIGYGLTAALKSQVTLKDGTVEQRNFNDFQLLRLQEMPRVEVYFVASDAPLGGIGEVGVPPLAPALGNAIFKATGKRLRTLPFVI
jgi:isoquinoline 1-oxidoreductase beta subunit